MSGILQEELHGVGAPHEDRVVERGPAVGIGLVQVRLRFQHLCHDAHRPSACGFVQQRPRTRPADRQVARLPHAREQLLEALAGGLAQQLVAGGPVGRNAGAAVEEQVHERAEAAPRGQRQRRIGELVLRLQVGLPVQQEAGQLGVPRFPRHEQERRAAVSVR